MPTFSDDGSLIDKNTKWAPMRVGEHVGVPQERVDAIIETTLTAVRPEFDAQDAG